MKPSLSPEEEAKQKKEHDEAKWDMIYMGIAVMCTLTIVTFFMVSFKFSRPTELPPSTSTSSNLSSTDPRCLPRRCKIRRCICADQAGLVQGSRTWLGGGQGGCREIRSRRALNDGASRARSVALLVLMNGSLGNKTATIHV